MSSAAGVPRPLKGSRTPQHSPISSPEDGKNELWLKITLKLDLEEVSSSHCASGLLPAPVFLMC